MAVKKRVYGIGDQGDKQTCWAFAIANVVGATKKREGKKFNQATFRNKLIKKYGTRKQNTSFILDEVCQSLGYYKKIINKEDICDALVSGRVLLVTYYLDNKIWKWIEKHLTKRQGYIVREKDFQ